MENKKQFADLNFDFLFPVNQIYYPCIYFLLKKGMVVYVGQTNNGLKRATFHLGNKDFDSIGIIKCSSSKLNELESYYIARFSPKYNRLLTNTQSPKNIKLRLKQMGINIRIEKIKKWIMENVKDIYTFNDGIYVSEQDALCCIKYFCKL